MEFASLSHFTVVMVAFGLAMDAFAVSVSSGLAMRNMVRVGQAFKIALYFGVFQGVMPVIGWMAGTGFRKLISAYDHWIAFGLLAGVGIKMIYESTRLGGNNVFNGPPNLYLLLVLSVATSIDALAVGLSLSFLRVSIIGPSIIIGLITFCLSLLGVYVGGKVGHFFEKKIEMVGGLILIAIGIKILIEHLA